MSIGASSITAHLLFPLLALFCPRPAISSLDSPLKMATFLRQRKGFTRAASDFSGKGGFTESHYVERFLSLYPESHHAEEMLFVNALFIQSFP